MHITITGASGHIGANLIRALIQRGDHVRALVHRDVRGLDGLDFERVPGDVRDPDAVSRAVKGSEIVYHLAARISILDRDDQVHGINVEGVRNMTEACMRHGVRRLVHFSSIHAFSPDPVDGVVDERRALVDDPRLPPYDRSKAAGQRVVLDAVGRGLDAVILHPAAVLGPHDYAPSRMGRVLLKLGQGRMPGLVEGGFSWVDVRDIVSAALAAPERGRKGENYLLSGHWLSVRELGKLAQEITGVRPPLFSSPMWLARLIAPAAGAAAAALDVEPLFTSAALHALRNHRRTSHAKAQAELGFVPRPTRETVADTYAWFREVGMLRA